MSTRLGGLAAHLEPDWVDEDNDEEEREHDQYCALNRASSSRHCDCGLED